MYPAAFSAFLTDLGTQTLGVRMERHAKNALTVAKYLEKRPEIERVNYPGLESDPYHELAMKYMPDGQSGVMSIVFKGGRNAAVKFMDSLKMANNIVHVADVRTCVLHPASATHRQLSDSQLIDAGISPGLVRLSVGIEDVSDILADIEQALSNI